MPDLLPKFLNSSKTSQAWFYNIWIVSIVVLNNILICPKHIPTKYSKMFKICSNVYPDIPNNILKIPNMFHHISDIPRYPNNIPIKSKFLKHPIFNHIFISPTCSKSYIPKCWDFAKTTQSYSMNFPIIPIIWMFPRFSHSFPISYSFPSSYYFPRFPMDFGIDFPIDFPIGFATCFPIGFPMILSFSKHLFLSTSPQHRAIRRHRARQGRQRRQRRGWRRLLRRGAQQRQQVAGRAGNDGDLLQLLGTRKKTAKTMGKIGKMWEETVKQHGKNRQQNSRTNRKHVGKAWKHMGHMVEIYGWTKMGGKPWKNWGAFG